MRKKLVAMMVVFSLCSSVLGVDSSKAAVKTKYYSVVDGKSITVTNAKGSLSNVNGKKVNVTKLSGDKIRIKGVAEGVTAFNVGKNKYKVHIVPNNVPKSAYDKMLKPSVKSNVYYTVREHTGGGFVTMYNNNSYAVDIVFKHDEYRTKKKLYETRTTYTYCLAPHESYTFSDYTMMPYCKRRISVSKSSQTPIENSDVDVTVGKSYDEFTEISLNNKTSKIVKVKLFLMKFDKDGKAYGYGETQEIHLPSKMIVSWNSQNYGIKPNKVKIIDYHVSEA